MIQPKNITERSKKRLKPKKIGDTGLNLIRVSDEMMDYSNLIGAGSNENGNQKEADPNPQRAELTAPQQTYLDALEQTKTTARERAGFLFDKPDKPELDEEQRKRFKNLTKAGAIAQLIDAVSDVALGARNQDYRPVPISGDELAFSGLQRVYEMDQDFRNEMRNYDQTVFNIKQENKQTQANLNRQNEAIDVEKSKTRLGFERNNAKARADALKIANDQENVTKDWYRDAALRFVSNGEPEIGLEMAKLGGMDTDAAISYLGLGETENKTKKPKAVIDYYNDYLGRGEDESLSKIEIRMLSRYKQLEQEMAEGDQDHYLRGEPLTRQAKEYEDLKKSLGNLRYAPSEDEIRGLYEESTPQDQLKDREGITNDNEALIKELVQAQSEEQQQQILQRLYANGEQLGLSQEQVHSDLQEVLNPQSQYNQHQFSKIQVPGATEPSGQLNATTKEGVQELKRYTSEVVEAFDNAESDEEKRAYLLKLGNVMERAGVNQNDITKVIESVFGTELKPLGKIDANDEDSLNKIEAYKWQASRAIKNADSEEELRSIAEQVEQHLRDAGLPDEQISVIGDEIFGLDNSQGTQTDTGQPENTGPTDSQRYFTDLSKWIDEGVVPISKVEKELPELAKYYKEGMELPANLFVPSNMRIEPGIEQKFEYLKRKFKAGEITTEEIARDYNPNIALLIQKGKELPATYKLNDWLIK